MHETVSEPTEEVVLDTIYDEDFVSFSAHGHEIHSHLVASTLLPKYVMGENVETRRGGRNVCSCKIELVLIYDK